MKTNLVSLLCTAALLAGGVPFAGAADIVTAIPTREMGQTVYVNDTRVTPTGYNIADNNYFKLRDIAALVGFSVEWDQDTQTVEISSERTTGNLNGITDSSVSGNSRQSKRPAVCAGWILHQHEGLSDRRQQLCEAA